MSEGHFPARSEVDNPASCARLPESATAPKRTVAATREDVQAILTALKGTPLARAAVAIIALTGVRPGEARGLRWEEWDRVQQHIAIRRAVWHKVVGTTKTEQSERYVTVTEELREILLELWKAQGMPIGGYILAGQKGQPLNLDNMAKRVIVPALKGTGTEWQGWYSMRRFLGTQVRMHADSETSAKALGNSKAVADRHYIKPETVLPDVRKAVNDALTGLIQ
jgi:integrase